MKVERLTRRRLFAVGLSSAAGLAAFPWSAVEASGLPQAPPAPGVPDIWVFGDSIVAGTWLSNPAVQAWPSRLNTRIAGERGHRVRNMGVPGVTVDHYPDVPHPLCTWAPAQVAAAAVKPRVVIVSAGVNDLMRVTDVGPLRWRMLYLEHDLLAAGAGKVLVTTILPYGRGPAQPDEWLPTLDARRRQVNLWIKAQWGGSGQVIDLAGVLEAPGSPYQDSRYCIDGLHPNEWGALRVADALPDSVWSL